MATPVSPRLAALEAALQTEGAEALERFWKEVAHEGTPLVEGLDGAPDEVLLTFVWRGEGDADAVAVVEGPGGGGLHPLERMAGTDLWYRTYTVPVDTRCTYQFLENPPPSDDPAQLVASFRRLRTDPLNPRQFRLLPDEEDCPSHGQLVTSVVELPQAPPQPWSEPREGVAPGQVDEYLLGSEILGNERRIWVHTPAGYDPGGDPSGLLVAFDGSLMVGRMVALPTTLDNLSAAAAVPPLVTVMVENPDPATRMRELACFPPFADFLADELVPFVRGRYHVTTDPARTVTAGGSHGGLASAYATLRRPDVFANFLSSSGSYWWNPDDDPEPEWLARALASSPVAPSRCYLEVGRFETGWTPNNGPDTLVCNRHLRNVLVAKGTVVHYAEFNGGHDMIRWRGTIAEGLIALTEGW